MLLPVKNLQEVVDSIMARLKETNLATATNGDVVKLIVDMLSKEFANDNKDGLYDLLDNNILMCFISSSEGIYLDRIGYMMNCTRNAGELDSSYRIRISQQLLNLATANETAIRLAILSIAGIDDVIMKPFSFGTGSGACYIVNKDPAQAANLVILAQAAADKKAAFGNMVKVYSVFLLEVEYWVRLLFSGDMADMDKDVVRFNAKAQIESYLLTRAPGEMLRPETIKTRVLKLNAGIIEMQNVKFTIDGETAFPVNQSCAFNERFVQSSAVGSVTVL